MVGAFLGALFLTVFYLAGSHFMGLQFLWVLGIIFLLFAVPAFGDALQQHLRERRHGTGRLQAGIDCVPAPEISGRSRLPAAVPPRAISASKKG